MLEESATDHLDLEELGAFLDGGLSAARRARIREHLGGCRDCYEIFSETAQLQQEMDPVGEGEVVRGRFRERRRWGLWAGYAAAAVLVVGVSAGIYQQLTRPADVSVASLSASLAAHLDQTKEQIWHETLRGVEDPNGDFKFRESSFRIGVELINLQTGLAADQEQVASGAVAKINQLLPDLDATDDVTKFYQDLYVHLSKTPPHELAAGAAAKADAVFKDYGEPFLVDFGKWAEAGRLAAVAQEPAFFAQRGVRRFPSDLRRSEEGRDLPPEVSKALDDIDRLLDSDDLKAADYDALKEAYSRILHVYYPGGEPYVDEPEAPAP